MRGTVNEAVVLKLLLGDPSRSMYLIDSRAGTPDSIRQLFNNPFIKGESGEIVQGYNKIVKSLGGPKERFENH